MFPQLSRITDRRRLVIDMPDCELAARSREDAEAFGILYDRYAPQIYRTVYSRIHDHADAEDITAEVFTKAWAAIHTYRPDLAPFRTWLHRITTNAVIDHVRTRRAVVPLDTVVDDYSMLRPLLTLPAPAVEEHALHRIEAARVWRAVAGLSPAQRTAVALRLGRDLPIATIARHMNRSEGAVRLLQHRGLATIRERLGYETPPLPVAA